MTSASDSIPGAAANDPRWIAAAPALFVLIWSTGFIGAKFGLPYCEPFTLLALRFALASALLIVFAWLVRAPWPRAPREWLHISVAGLLLHCGYMGGVYKAIDWDMPAGLSALIVGVQPLLTGALVPLWLREKVSARQWFGLALGLAGVGLVLWPKLSVSGLSFAALSANVVALLGITSGTLYQKRYCPNLDLRTGLALQFLMSTLAMLVCALLFEQRVIHWGWPLALTLVWLVLVLSLGSISLLYVLIRRGAAAKVASLFYLVPPVTTAMAWALFGERFSAVALAGMALSVVAVALVTHETTKT